jgi:hypothetical protein
MSDAAPRLSTMELLDLANGTTLAIANAMNGKDSKVRSLQRKLTRIAYPEVES